MFSMGIVPCGCTIREGYILLHALFRAGLQTGREDNNHGILCTIGFSWLWVSWCGDLLVVIYKSK